MKFLMIVPVHNHVEFLNFQLSAFFKFYPELHICLSVNKENELDFSQLIEHSNLHINPTRIFSSRYDVFSGMANAFEYMQNKMDFDYVILHSSSALPLFDGMLDRIETSGNYAGFVEYDLGDHHSFITTADEIYYAISQHLNITDHTSGVWEGSYYKRELFDEILKNVKQFYPNIYEDDRPIYGRYPMKEELYFHNIAKKLLNNQRIGHGLTDVMNLFGVSHISRTSMEHFLNLPNYQIENLNENKKYFNYKYCIGSETFFDARDLKQNKIAQFLTYLGRIDKGL